MQKLLIVTAPSGAGKTTLIRHLMSVFPILAFSVSATTRAMRAGEVQGKDYLFMSVEEFKAKIESDDFVEWVEVYENQFYGTLKSELARIGAAGQVATFDIDVLGAKRIQKKYRPQSLSFFIAPPSLAILRQRLLGRKSESPASLQKRIDRAEMECSFAPRFDIVIVNDDLYRSKSEIERITRAFLEA